MAKTKEEPKELRKKVDKRNKGHKKVSKEELKEFAGGCGLPAGDNTMHHTCQYCGMDIRARIYEEIEEHEATCLQNPNRVEQYTPSNDSKCIPETALVTLSDGSQVPVSRIREGDSVLALDHMTGAIRPCRVTLVVNHHEVSALRRVTVLTFDDGRETAFIEEHGYLDLTTRRYEYMRPETAKGFIGHAFAFAENGTVTAHRLTEVTDHVQMTRAYELVTEGAVDFVSDGAVSCTQLTDVLLNMFPLAPDSLQYDAELVKEAVRQYGYTKPQDYPMIPEEIFTACHGQYLKAAIATGGINPDAFDVLLNLFDRECRTA